MKYKCFKAECPECKVSGSIQLFLNRNNQVRYARTRHYSHIDKVTRKPRFTYCKITDLEALKTLLSNNNTSLTTNKEANGQVGQEVNAGIHDHKLLDLSFNSLIKGAGSSARIEHHPPKVGVVGSNPTPPVGDTPRTVLEICVSCLHSMKGFCNYSRTQILCCRQCLMFRVPFRIVIPIGKLVFQNIKKLKTWTQQ